MKQRERRCVADALEMRGTIGEGAVLTGHAAVFDQETVIAGWYADYRELVAPGAFRKSIQEADVRALFNHDPSWVLGRTRSGTLRLREDEYGLWYEVDLPDTQQARDVWTLINRGDVTQSSFAFDIVKDEWNRSDKENPLRTIREVKLYDVSPVTYPAYEGTDVDVERGLRSLSAAASLPLEEVRRLVDEGHLSRLWTPEPATNDAVRSATTQEPEPEPQEHSETTQEPEPKDAHLTGHMAGVF